MPARIPSFLFPAVLLSFLVSAASSSHLQAQAPLTPQTAAATIHRMPADREEYIRWQEDCDGPCVLSTDILRGASGDPPDRTDHDQYITLSISLRKSGKPDAILLHLPPWADKDRGFFLAFVTKPPTDPNAPPQLDADGAVRLAINSCDDESCLTQIPDGLIPSGSPSDGSKPDSRIDLFDKLLHSDHLILLFTSDGAPYRTSIPLDTFHKAWQDYQKEQFNQ